MLHVLNFKHVAHEGQLPPGFIPSTYSSSRFLDRR